MSDLKYCKDCIHAKRKDDREPPLWFCGKHRLYVTKSTCFSFYSTGGKDCTYYEERGKK